MFVYRKLMAKRRGESTNTTAVENGSGETAATQNVDNKATEEEKKQNSPKKEVKIEKKQKEVKETKKVVKIDPKEEKTVSVSSHTKVEFQVRRVKYTDSRYKTEPDFTLTAEDIEYRVHSALLKEKSEVIRKALSADTKHVDDVGRGHGMEFVKPPPTARALRILMDYIYTDKFNVPEEAKTDVYIAAKLLKISVDEDALIGWDAPAK
ncbi:uncharacterized protein [Ptychodera flava]|uniref:uncharacterized protein n=1 Tax=Ptychodera flava TaxID=63121 RepID=UPI003969E1BB